MAGSGGCDLRSELPPVIAVGPTEEDGLVGAVPPHFPQSPPPSPPLSQPSRQKGRAKAAV